MNELEIVSVVAVVVLSLLLLWAGIRIQRLTTERDRADYERYKAQHRVTVLEGRGVGQIKWSSIHWVAEGVPVGLDPTENVTITLTAKGAEAYRVNAELQPKG